MLTDRATSILPCLLLAALPATLLAGEPREPKILLIYSDDHGWADLGAQGSRGFCISRGLPRTCRSNLPSPGSFARRNRCRLPAGRPWR